MIFDIIISVLMVYLSYKMHQHAQISKQQAFEEFERNSQLVTIEEVEQSGKKFWLVYSFEEYPKFLAQGNSEEEAIDNVVKLFPEKHVYKTILK
jgi:hypothetical protein